MVMKNIEPLPEAPGSVDEKVKEANVIRRHRCARCKRAFRAKKEGQIYGPKCARKLAGQVQLDSMALVSGKVLRKKTSQTNPEEAT